MAAEFEGWAIARHRIAKEACERTGKLDLRGLGLEELPPEVAGLTHLRELDLGYQYGEEVTNDAGQLFASRRNQIADLAPLSRLTALQTLDCSYTEVADLTPLARLTALQSLSCFRTQVADLTRLARLTALQSLDCSLTQVADLAPLARLNALQLLQCGGTRVGSLAPLARLTALESLGCGTTLVDDLEPLARLTTLQSLEFAYTEVADLAPLARLTALQSLNCLCTLVADLTPLAGLTALQLLDCSDTRVADLAPLAGLTTLHLLDCSDTQVADLGPLTALTALRSLRCGRTKLTDLSRLRDFPALEQVDASHLRLRAISRSWVESERASNLDLYDTYIRDIPSGILSNSYDDNCLPALRAYFQDSGPDDPRVEDVKLMVLGNGRVGKTQLCRNLAGEPFEPEANRPMASRSTRSSYHAAGERPRSLCISGISAVRTSTTARMPCSCATTRFSRWSGDQRSRPAIPPRRACCSAIGRCAIGSIMSANSAARSMP
jgi:internalin A